MTEQELLKKIGTLTTPEHLLECAKAYADARAHESKEVAMKAVEARNEFAKQLSELRREWEDKNTEIAELKASLSQAQQMYTDLLVGTTDAINAKDAEIKRLRDGIQKVADHLWVREPRNMSWLELRDQVSILHGLLSPAPVTYQPDILTKILTLPDDTSAAYIKALIHDHIKTE